MTTRAETIEIIRNYPHLNRLIHERRQAILHPYQAFEDENINGGRAQNVRNEAIERSVEQLDADVELNALYKQQEAVSYVLGKCVDKQVRSLLDNTTYDIIYEFYLREDQIYSAEGIARKVGLSRSGMYKRKDAFINAVQEELSKVDKKWTITQK